MNSRNNKVKNLSQFISDTSVFTSFLLLKIFTVTIVCQYMSLLFAHRENIIVSLQYTVSLKSSLHLNVLVSVLEVASSEVMHTVVLDGS